MSKRLDLTGRKFAKWTALHYVERSRDESGKLVGAVRWMCRCDCGTEREVQLNALIAGRISNCGCVRRLAAYPKPGKKRCSSCKQVKDVALFKKQMDKVTATCKTCESEKRKSWAANDRRRLEDKKRCRKYYKTNRQACLDSKKQHADNNVDLYRLRRMERIFGLTKEQFDRIFERQGFCCAICRAEKPSKKPKMGWHIDHDHETGLIRGILCGTCNPMLGLCRDSEAVLQAAIDYLKISPAKTCGIEVTAPPRIKKNPMSNQLHFG